MGKKQTLGIVGSILLFAGVFTPIVSLPVVGSMNYFQNGQGDGVFVLVLGLISLVLALTKRYRWLWVTGLLSLGLMMYTFVSFRIRLSGVQAEMKSKLADNPFKGIADVAMQSVQIQWGWAVLQQFALLLTHEWRQCIRHVNKTYWGVSIHTWPARLSLIASRNKTWGKDP